MSYHADPLLQEQINAFMAEHGQEMRAAPCVLCGQPSELAVVLVAPDALHEALGCPPGDSPPYAVPLAVSPGCRACAQAIAEATDRHFYKTAGVPYPGESN